MRSFLTPQQQPLRRRPAGIVQTPRVDPADPGTDEPRGHTPPSLSLPAPTAGYPAHQPTNHRPRLIRSRGQGHRHSDIVMVNRLHCNEKK